MGKLHEIIQRFASQQGRSQWVAFSFVSMLGMIDLVGVSTLSIPTWIQVIALTTISAFKGMLFTILLSVCNRSAIRWLGWTVAALYCLACVVNACCFMLYGFGITHRMIVIIAQTNIREISEFLPGLLSNLISRTTLGLICVGIVMLAVVYMLVRLPGKRCYIAISGTLSMLGLIMLTVCIFSLNSRAPLIMYVRIPKYLMDTIKENREYEAMMACMRPLPYADQIVSSKKASLIIMVVGESASRSHHSVYGYSLPTNPGLQSIQDSLIIMTDAIGSSASTAGNMERILSLKVDDTTTGDWYKYPLLIDIFNASGYKTFWLSNQERRGLMSNSSGAMADHANVVKYVGAESSEDYYTYRYDEVVLPEIESAISDPLVNKFIGVHLLGSHTKYENRYPDRFNKFSAGEILQKHQKSWLTNNKAEIVAEYDNSILYTDSILTEIVKKVACYPGPAIFIYFSDHGENVYDDRDFLGRDRRSVKVPFIIYANAVYRKNNPDIVEHMHNAVNKPVSTANVPFALMTAAGISYPLYDAKNDFFSSEYIVRPRYVDEEIWE